MLIVRRSDFKEVGGERRERREGETVLPFEGRASHGQIDLAGQFLGEAKLAFSRSKAQELDRLVRKKDPRRGQRFPGMKIDHDEEALP